ncbi:MAG: hypothetical protein H0X37_05980 [Herpetosiphonaceae bacterium]|nr:hypothetical protein [Herpetosiphonaceae bacterium]
MRRVLIFFSSVLLLCLVLTLFPVKAASETPSLPPVVYLPLIRKDGLPAATPTPTNTPVPTNTPAPTPTASTSATPTMTPTPTNVSGDVPVLSSSTYVANGSRSIVGEVENNTSSNVEFVKIVASLYNSSGGSIGSSLNYADLDILTPGQRAPFSILISSPPAGFDHYTLQTQWTTTSLQPISCTTVLSVSDRSAGFDDARLIDGQVRNDCSSTVQFVRLVATLYDASGRVVQAGLAFSTIATLTPGQTSPFEIAIEPWNGATRYEVQTEAQLAP